jgi:asparagine synthase (glutamine-hydrolysing)
VQYWKRNYKNKLKISFDEAVEEVDRLLNLAVSKRLVADVAVGSLLSGGLDSSIVTAIAAKYKNNIPTFNVKFTEKSFSEHLYARRVSDFVGTEHTEVTAQLEKNDFWKNIFKIYGAPYSDSSAIPTFLLCRAASQHVRVALSGDGADEIFGGYSRYRNILIGDLLPTKNLSFDEYLKFIKSDSKSKARKYITKFSCLLKNSDLFGYPLINEFYSFEEISNFLNTNIDNLFSTHWLYEEIKEARENADSRLDRLLYFDNKHYLPGDLLIKTDISSMRNSLEIRTPFCDSNLIEFVNALPDSFKINRNEGKILLKEVAKKYIPLDIIERRKKGFTVPLTSWLDNYFIDEFSNPKSSIFDNEIGRRVDLFNETPNSNESKLWSLLALNNYN